MTATAFAKCHRCSALLPDNPDDRREHLAEHADVAKKLEAQRNRVGALLAEIGQLKDAIVDFRRTLDSHPITAEPTEIVVNDIPDDEIDEFDDLTGYAGEPAESAADLDNPVSTYADDDVNATVALEPADLPLPTGSVTNLYSA